MLVDAHERYTTVLAGPKVFRDGGRIFETRVTKAYPRLKVASAKI